MASHSDGSESDDTWLFGDEAAIYNGPHKCHGSKARNSTGEGKQQVGRQGHGQIELD